MPLRRLLSGERSPFSCAIRPGRGLQPRRRVFSSNAVEHGPRPCACASACRSGSLGRHVGQVRQARQVRLPFRRCKGAGRGRGRGCMCGLLRQRRGGRRGRGNRLSGFTQSTHPRTMLLHVLGVVLAFPLLSPLGATVRTVHTRSGSTCESQPKCDQQDYAHGTHRNLRAPRPTAPACTTPAPTAY